MLLQTRIGLKALVASDAYVTSFLWASNFMLLCFPQVLLKSSLVDEISIAFAATILFHMTRCLLMSVQFIRSLKELIARTTKAVFCGPPVAIQRFGAAKNLIATATCPGMNILYMIL